MHFKYSEISVREFCLDFFCLNKLQLLAFFVLFLVLVYRPQNLWLTPPNTSGMAPAPSINSEMCVPILEQKAPMFPAFRTQLNRILIVLVVGKLTFGSCYLLTNENGVLFLYPDLHCPELGPLLLISFVYLLAPFQAPSKLVYLYFFPHTRMDPNNCYFAFELILYSHLDCPV